MPYKYLLISPMSLGIQPIDDTFPIILQLKEAPFVDWYISINKYDGKKLECEVVRVPQSTTDKQVAKAQKKLYKHILAIIKEFIEEETEQSID